MKDEDGSAYCPDCGSPEGTYKLECTPADAGGEYKEVWTCGECKNLFYMVRGV